MRDRRAEPPPASDLVRALLREVILFNLEDTQRVHDTYAWQWTPLKGQKEFFEKPVLMGAWVGSLPEPLLKWSELFLGGNRHPRILVAVRDELVSRLPAAKALDDMASIRFAGGPPASSLRQERRYPSRTSSTGVWTAGHTGRSCHQPLAESRPYRMTRTRQ